MRGRISKRGASPLSYAPKYWRSLEGAKPLLKTFPLPLIKGKGIQGIGFLHSYSR